MSTGMEGAPQTAWQRRLLRVRGKARELLNAARTELRLLGLVLKPLPFVSGRLRDLHLTTISRSEDTLEQARTY